LLITLHDSHAQRGWLGTKVPDSPLKALSMRPDPWLISARDASRWPRTGIRWRRRRSPCS